MFVSLSVVVCFRAQTCSTVRVFDPAPRRLHPRVALRAPCAPRRPVRVLARRRRAARAAAPFERERERETERALLGTIRNGGSRAAPGLYFGIGVCALGCLHVVLIVFVCVPTSCFRFIALTPHVGVLIFNNTCHNICKPRLLRCAHFCEDVQTYVHVGC